MRKVLFIVAELRSANGICCLNVMKYLKSKGLEVACITNREYRDADRFEIDDIQFYTVRPRWIYSIESYLNHKKTVWNRAISLFRIILNKVQLVMSIPTWPLISHTWKNRLFRASDRLCREMGIDTVVPVFTPIDTLIVAKKLKRFHSEIRVIPYFLDSLSGGYGPRYFSKDWIIARGVKWERKLLDCADLIVMMKSAQEHYAEVCKSEIYYKKILFLDLPLFTPQPVARDHKSVLPQDTVNILFVGTIPKPIRNPEYFLELFKRIQKRNLRLFIVGSSNCESLLQRYAKEDSRICLRSFVTHDEAVDLVRSADILLNFGNANKSMTPSKIFEYMSYGKPIISTAPIDDEPCIEYLDKYPLAIVIKEKISMMDSNVTAIESFIDNCSHRDYDSRELAACFYLNTPGAFHDAVVGKMKVEQG